MSVESILARIAAASGNFAHLPPDLAGPNCFHANFCSDSRAIGNATDALNDQPVVLVSVISIEKVVLIVQVRNEQIEKAIIVVISPGGPITDGSVVDQASGGDLRKGAIPIVVIQKIILPGTIGRSVGDEQV